MLKMLKMDRQASELARGHVIFLLVLVSMGSSIIYSPAYLKYVFYNQLLEALQITDGQLGKVTAAYALTATICYLPSGILADKIRVRILGWVGFGGTALLTYLYAMVPSIAASQGSDVAYGILYFIHIAMGVTTILIWWGIRFKLIRLISDGDEDYAKKIGFSYGVYGAAGLIMGVINAAILNYLHHSVGLGVQVLLTFLASVILVLGLLTFFWVPRFTGEICAGNAGFSLAVVGRALSLPVVWIAAIGLFLVYFFYSNMYFITPYFTDIIGADQATTDMVSVVRTYGVTLLSGPIFGILATKSKSPSKVIFAGSLIAAAVLTTINVVPSSPSIIMIVAGLQMLLAFIANGVFGICSSQLSEGRVPLSVFGTATGLLSVIGFFPDTICPVWFGGIIDAAKAKHAETGNIADLAAGYHTIFWYMAGAAVLAAVFAAALFLYVRANQEKLDAAALAEVEATA